MRALRLSATDPFRYMHLSGRLAEKDQTKHLWFLQDARHVKGLAEIKLMEFTSRDAQVGFWETYIARPSMIVPNPPGAFNNLAGWAVGAIRVDQLAKVMIEIVQEGSEREDRVLTVNMREIHGRAKSKPGVQLAVRKTQKYTTITLHARNSAPRFLFNIASEWKNKAAWNRGKGSDFQISYTPFPALEPDYVNVSNRAVAITTIDWKVPDSGQWIS
ncbi:hypothetical protein LTR84_010298 [Exophiala bonariae]|uniref:Uncharacterized protein n=1 Tax=Exophiala bonariae TaxID=1690606 RepID=A0AAV9MTE8_9EURO|nr:hypothetical protein LTR84_010298 [Exophiala bonariae]